MGIFDLFKKNSASSEEKELQRLQKMITNKLSQNLDREDALHRLVGMASPQAAAVLLTRFSWKLDPSIKDQEEKELAVRGVVAAGPDAKEVVRRYCVKAESLTWPLKALREIVDPAQFEAELLGLLDEFDTEYMRNPEPKIQLLQVLAEYSSEDVRIAVQPFLTDMNEEVRFNAATVVLGCNDAEALDSLIDALTEEESLRVKNRICTTLVEKGWTVSDAQAAKLAPVLPPGFRLEGGRLSGAPAS